MAVSNFFDRAVVINLRRRPDRLANFWKELERVDWPFVKPTVFEAVDGNKVPTPNGFISGGGAWGCLQSHRRILEKAILDDVKTLLVLEDDACLRATFREEMDRFLAEVPSDWDQLMLGGQHIGSSSKPVKAGVVRCSNCQRTHAYAVRGRFLRDLYARWCEIGVDRHCDHIMGPFAGEKYKVYAPDPFIFGQDRSKSDISGSQNPKKFWTPPTGREPVIYLEAPRHVLEELRQFGVHPGYDRETSSGLDKGLLKVMTQAAPREALRKWINDLQWEAASEEGLIVCVWHPLATEALVRSAWTTGPVIPIKAETLEEARKQLPSAKKVSIPSRRYIVLLHAPRSVAVSLRAYGFHQGFWCDPVSQQDNGLRAMFDQGDGLEEKLRDWICTLANEAESVKGVVTVWHPDCSLEMVKAATSLEAVEITADNVDSALRQWEEATNEKRNNV